MAITSSSSSSTSSTSTTNSSLSSISSLSSSSKSSSSLGSSSSTSSQSSSSSSSQSSLSSEGFSSSSSSSSSYNFLYSQIDTIPFTLEVDQLNTIWCLHITENYVYIGNSKGIVLRSKDRTTWEKFCQIEDVHVTAIHKFNNLIFIGTSPKGKIYAFDLDELTLYDYGSFGSKIVSFSILNNEIYVATEGKSTIYKFDSITDTWNTFYQTGSSHIFQFKSNNGNLYISTENPNIQYFENNQWKWTSPSFDNISSFRNVNVLTKSPWNHEMNSQININNVNTFRNNTEEVIKNSFPLYFSEGIQSVAFDGSSLIFGSSTKGKVFSYQNEKIRVLLDVDGNIVHDIMRVDTGEYLASIDNKLYFIKSKDIDGLYNFEEESVENIPPEEETEEASPAKNVNIINPLSSSIFELGETINIQWSSIYGINDAIKLELWKAGEFLQTINDQTANDGTYQWEIPLSLEDANDYQIYIEWLSAGEAADNDKDISDNFTILNQIPVTTTTTTTEPQDPNEPVYEGSYGIPLLQLEQNDYVRKMEYDTYSGQVLFITNKGQLIASEKSSINAYNTGENKIYANVKDYYGFTSETSSTSFIHALYNKIIEINRNKEEINSIYSVRGVAIGQDRITGSFLSPIIYTQDDIGSWRSLFYRGIIPLGSDIVICVRTGKTIEELQNTDFKYCFRGTLASANYLLNNLPLIGRYAQIKLVVSAVVGSSSPIIDWVGLAYTTQNALYFFTTKFELKANTEMNKGMLIANVSSLKGTEITFGYTDKNTNDWNQYNIIDPNKVFDMDISESVKIGVKLVSYGENVPEVSEFALLTGATKLNLVKDL